jgi:Fe-S-cluster containining protein
VQDSRWKREPRCGELGAGGCQLAVEKRVYSLSIHADYRCRHSGVCCSTDWDVPVELPVFRNLDAAIRSNRLRPFASAEESGAPLVMGADLPHAAAAIFARTAEGRCVFFHGGSHLCIVHRDFGAEMLPATCRHFPRVAVRDARGTFISLTHYCPTAASMLFRNDVPVEIVSSPPAFPPGDYDGLTVNADAWPPLLSPRMLMDLEGYSAWERHMVECCANLAASPETVVATLERDARVLRTFVPDGTSLAGPVQALPGDMVEASAPATLDASMRRHREVMATVPDEFKPAPDEHDLHDAYAKGVAPHWTSWHAPLNRYLAAKAFANWTAYQGRGLLSIVRGLEAAIALVRVEAARQCRDARRPLDAQLLLEAFRSADFALNHLAVGEDLAAAWSSVEN